MRFKLNRGSRWSRITSSAIALVTVLVVSVAVAACGSSSTPSYSTYKAAFLKGCEGEAGGSSKLCNCTYSKIEASVSINTFTTASKALENGTGKEPSWATQAAEACLGSS